MRLTLGLLLMAALLHSSQSSLKTFCLKSEADCDSSWSPIENIDAALVGYDLPTANPFASDFIEDPGLRKQIFNATVPSINNDGKSDGFRLESGISAREYLMCDGHFKTKIATSISGYKKVCMPLFIHVHCMVVDFREGRCTPKIHFIAFLMSGRWVRGAPSHYRFPTAHKRCFYCAAIILSHCMIRNRSI
jgi:hypothetical protein